MSEVRQVDHIKRVRGGRGYLLIDERAAPSGTVLECPTQTCRHCNRVVILRPDRVRPRGYCQRCYAYVCDACTQTCTPFEQLIDFAINNPTVDVLNDQAAVQRLQEQGRIY